MMIQTLHNKWVRLILRGGILLLLLVPRNTVAQAHNSCLFPPFYPGFDVMRETKHGNVPIWPDVNGYLQFLPKGYNAGDANKKYPLVIYFHGVGELGPGDTTSLCNILKAAALPWQLELHMAPDSVLINGTYFPYILMAPQYSDFNVGADGVNAVLNYTLHTAFANKVDTNRIYLTGISSGSNFVYAYVGAKMSYAQNIAAIAPIAPCSGPTAGEAANIANANIAVFGLQCSTDGTCSPQNTVDWANAINANNPNILARDSLLAPIYCNNSLPHDIWGSAYEGDNHFFGGKTFYDWIFQFSKGDVLPVVLKSFTANLSGGKVNLNWTTESESNTKVFNLEKAASDMQFQGLATVPAAGNSNVEKNYKWVDNDPLPGISFYRLSQTDLDGKQKYFEIKRVLNSNSKGNTVTIAPNPIYGNQVTTYINIDKPQNISLIITDLNGKRLKIVNGSYQQGSTEVSQDVADLPPGLYLLHVQGEFFTQIKKVIRQ